MVFLEKSLKIWRNVNILVFCLFFSSVFAANNDTFRIKQFIVLEDVLHPQEKSGFKMESTVNARYNLLETDSKLTDLGRSFPIELAVTGSCLKEMEILNRCLSVRNERLSITTQNVSKARKLNIKQIEIVEKGEKLLVDEDCTNNQIDLEECIINNNRYYPCTPPEKDLKKYRNLFVERTTEFANILKTNGYRLKQAFLQFEFGNLQTFEVLNFDDKYKELSKNFIKNFPEEKLPEPFENFKEDFLKLRNAVPKNSLKFFKFQKFLKSVACQREIPDNSEVLENSSKKIGTMKKKLPENIEELEKIEKSLQPFLEQIPKKVPEKCDEKYQQQVENKIKVMEAFGWDCKEED